MSYVNDDYCDCDDGSDEPGTSACSNGSFYCVNKQFKGNHINYSIESLLITFVSVTCISGTNHEL